MSSEKVSSFEEKHGPDARPDPKIVEAIQEVCAEKGLACAVAFAVADKLGVSPAAVGKTADLIGCRLIKCQLGLFGYEPEKKIVGPKPPEDPAIAEALGGAARNDRIACKKVWEIADRFSVRKMTASAACEALGLKVKPCQLGAF